MNSNNLSRIILKGYKSIKECELKLHDLNILIGSNGAGKSNFISFFKLIQQILDKQLQTYISKQGGPDNILYCGRKKTEEINAELYFGNNGYKISLEPTTDNKMIFSKECFWWNQSGDRSLGSGHFESEYDKGTKTGIDRYVIPAMKSWRVYHFHDTSETALVKQKHSISFNESFQSDARNLAAFLHLLRENHDNDYNRIVKTVQLVAPFFGDFILRPDPYNKESIELGWKEKGIETPFKANALSDGTLRFICLTTVLMQPEEYQPDTIIIDEPELGLHPYAIKLLASMLRSASKSKQIIVSTQSVELLNEFEAEDIIIADRTPEGTNIHRLDSEKLKEWLEEYSLGELWQKNLLGGRPSR